MGAWGRQIKKGEMGRGRLLRGGPETDSTVLACVHIVESTGVVFVVAKLKGCGVR